MLTLIEKQHCTAYCSSTPSVRNTRLHNAALYDAGTVESTVMFQHEAPMEPWRQLFLRRDPEAQFLVPDWGMKPTLASGCRSRPPAYLAWRAGSKTRRLSRLHPPS